MFHIVVWWGMKTPTYLPKTVDSWEYASMLNEGMYNRNAAKW